MSADEIEARIPHREPFLLVDGITDEGEDWIETTWTVPADADWVRGHYPARPVTPGVLLCEHAFQSAALLIAGAREVAAEEDDVPVLTRIDDARFRRMVRPGEEVRTRVQVEDRVGPAWILEAQVTCGDRRALRLRFTLTSTGALGALGV